MRKTRCATNPEIDREDGAVTVSRSRTLGKALLPWAVAAATLFGGGLTVQAQEFSPDECTTSGEDNEIVTCTGNLSGGVKVNSPDDTYNTLEVNTLNGDIAPEAGTSGINFNTHNEATDTYGNTDITLTVDTGANGITTKGTNARGISARSAGDVTVTVTGKITAKGICHTSDNRECSEGVYARSEGDGDVTVNVTGDIETEGDPDELSGLGTTSSAGIYAKSGGEGGDDGAVTVTFTGNIKAKQRSRGIYADSDGAVTVNMKKGSNITTEGISADGIYAKSNGDGDVMVTVDGNINTLGEEHSNGIAAESRGTGAVTVTVTGNIKTSGEYSEGISADSRGGGDVTVTMTGDITTSDENSDGISADSDDDGDVTVTMMGDITTYGKESYGISASSDGGVTVDLEGNITTTEKKSRGISASIEDENSAGNIEITVVTGDITTSGEESAGIFAESYGKGDVTVNMTGDITTSGDITTTGDCKLGSPCSQGIYAQSRGNGTITVNVTGDITTSDDNSQGIYAYSDDESGTDNLNSSALVTINVTGDIETEGDNSHGISAQSNGAISIMLHGGTITSAKGAGVAISGEATNTLTILGPVTILGGERIRTNGVLVTYDDVQGGSENETIDNYGTLTTPGTINLISDDPNFVDVAGAQTNVFNNHTGATFNSGTSVVLGDDLNDIFANAGDLSPGVADVVQTTALTGNFQNFRTDAEGILRKGTFTVTIDPEAKTSDRLTVTGTAELGGTVKVTGVTYAYKDTYTILEAGGGRTGKFDGVIDTLFIDNMLSYVGNTVTLSSTSKGDSFSYFAGTPNQLAVANVLDSLLSPNTNTELVQAGRAQTTTAEAQAASNGNQIVRAVLALTTTAGARAAYDNLSGEVHASLKGALMDTAQRPVAAVHRRLTARGHQPDARTSTAVVGDLSSRADGESGFWMTSYGAWGDTKATANTAQMDTELGGILFGMDRTLDKRWRLGVLGGYGQTSVGQGARGSSGSAETWSVGLYGGGEVGASRLRFGALYNGHSVTTGRTVRFPSERLSARYDARSWQFFAEAGHQLQAGNVLLEPFAGVSHIRLGTDGFSETGGTTTAALTALSDTNSRTLTTLGVRSAMEVQDTVQARGLVGWRHAFGDTDPSASTHTLANSDPFTALGAPTAQDAVVTELGLEVGLSAHAVLGVAYQGRYGDGVTVHGINAGLKVTF